MRKRYLRGMCMTAAVVTWLPSFVAAQSANDTPHTAWGDPDLQGVWDYRTLTPLERPEELADKEFLTEEEAATLRQSLSL